MDFDPWNDDAEHLLEDEPVPPPLSLTPAQQSTLADHVGRALRARACDGTLRVARWWALTARLPWTRLVAELDVHGVYCDCELLGVLPDAGGS